MEEAQPDQTRDASSQDQPVWQWNGPLSAVRVTGPNAESPAVSSAGILATEEKAAVSVVEVDHAGAEGAGDEITSAAVLLSTEDEEEDHGHADQKTTAATFEEDQASKSSRERVWDGKSVFSGKSRGGSSRREEET